MEFYVNLASIEDLEKTITAKLTFEIDTSISIRFLRSEFKTSGLKIYIQDLLSNIDLKISKIVVVKDSVNYLYKLEKLAIYPEGKKFRIENIVLTDFNTIANVSIKERVASNSLFEGGDSINEQIVTDFLVEGRSYSLYVELVKNTSRSHQTGSSGNEDFTIRKNSLDLSKFNILLSVSGVDFDIQESFKTVSMPTERDSEKVSFTLMPRSHGDLKLDISFYYKLNLIQVLRVPLRVHPKTYLDSSLPQESKTIFIDFKNTQYLLPTEAIVYSDNGLESILDKEFTR